jgi:hypothetical protein
MHEKRRRPQWVDDPCIAERAVVLQILRDDREVRWLLAELEAEAFDVVPSVLWSAVERLEQHGIVVPCGGHMVASRCALHLDALGMVSI